MQHRFWLTVGAVFSLAAAAEETASLLTLDAYLRQVLEMNQTLAAQKLGLEIAVEQVAREKGVFEPDFVLSGGRSKTERANNAEQARNQAANFFVEDRDSAKAGLEGLLPTGGKYRVGTSMDDIRNNLVGNVFTYPGDPQYQAFAGVSLTQPLLRHAWSAGTMTRIRLAKVESEMATQDYRRRLMEVVARAEAAYWDLALAQRDYEITQESVRVAEKVLQDNRERVKNGKMSEIEVAQAESGLAFRRAQAEDTRQKRGAAVNQLLTFMSQSVAAQAPALVAADSPGVRTLDVAFDTAMTQALKVHPDYLRQLKTIEQEEIKVAYARNQRWPQVDLVASYGYNGLGETSGKAWDAIMDNNYEAWNIGLEIRVPLGGGSSSRHDLAAAQLRRRQALMELKSIEVELANSLHTVLDKARTSATQVQSYKTIADFNRRLLEVELARLETGKSDSRKVFDVESDLFKARSAENQSLVDHQKAFIELDLVQGTALSRRSVEVVGPPAP